MNIREIIKDDIKFLVYVLTVLGGITVFIVGISANVSLLGQKLDKIENNALVHVQASIKELDNKVGALGKEEQKLEIMIVKIMARLGIQSK